MSCRALVQERRAGLLLQMALSATGLDVLRRQQRLFPLLGCVVRFFHGGGGALSAMAGGAAKLRQRVRNDRMLAKCYRADIGKAVFFQSKMAGGAAVGHLLLGNPDLLDAAFEMAFQGDGVGAAANEM